MFSTRRISIPLVGKGALAQQRMRTAADIISSNGASNVFMTRVMGGHGAGSMHLYAMFESMEQTMQVGANLMEDQAWASLMAEREADPSAEVLGPDLVRLIAGQPHAGNSAMMVREWSIPRSKMADAVEMHGKILNMVKDHGINLTMWAPMIAADMTRMVAVYSAADMVALGRGVDQVGLTPEFQSLLVEASQIGTLQSAWGMVRID